MHVWLYKMITKARQGNAQNQIHRCTMTLFFNPPASMVTLSSSRVLLGKVVPMVYGRASDAGLDLSRKSEQQQCEHNAITTNGG